MTKISNERLDCVCVCACVQTLIAGVYDNLTKWDTHETDHGGRR